MAVLRDVKLGHAYPLRGKITLIGRDPVCDVVVRTEQTSWRHALVVHSSGAYSVEDLDSVNGTFVNGQRISQRTLLRPGDRVQVSGLTVEFQEDPAPALLEGLATTPSASRATVLTTGDTVGGAVNPEVDPASKLRAVLEITRQLSGALDIKEVLPKILESLFVVFPQADRGFVLLRDANTGQLTPKAARQRRGPEKDAPAVSRNIIEQVVATGRTVLSADAGQDARFDPTQSIRRFKIRSILCAPMLSQSGAVLGAIQLDAGDVRTPFREEDVDVLAMAATQAARAVELAWLHQERRDLEAATQIQKSFLPNARPQVAGLRFFDYYSPARHVGGDYYDYIPLPGGRLAVALGDVSGKGVPAALLMARLSAAARFALAAEPNVPEAVRRLNASLTQSGRDDRYVTFVAAVLDLSGFTMTLVNAGHMPPLRRRAGRAEVDEVGEPTVGLPLAVMDKPYEQTVVPLEPGDAVLLYTDGVTEARNPAGELYGLERLRAALHGGPEDVEGLGKAILADVTHFAAGRPQSDDLTIVCFGRDK